MSDKFEQEAVEENGVDIYIIGTEIKESKERSPFWESRPQVKRLDPEKLRGSITAFVASMQGVIKEAPEHPGGFELEEIEFHVEIGIDGSVGFLGTGVKSSGKGGAKMKFVRRRVNK